MKRFFILLFVAKTLVCSDLPIISDVTIFTPHKLISDNEFLYLLSLRKGTPWDEYKHYQTVYRFFATGFFRDVQTFIAYDYLNNRIKVKYNLIPKDFIKKISFVGLPVNLYLGAYSLVSDLLNTPLESSRILPKVYRLNDFLRDKGYIDSHVRVIIKDLTDGKEINFNFYVGKRYTLNKVVVEGIDFTIPGMYKYNSRYLTRELLEDIELYIKRHLYKNGYFKIEIKFLRFDPVNGGNEATVFYRVSLGTKYTVKVRGIRKEKLKDIIDFSKVDITGDTISTLIKDYFQLKGFFKVNVVVSIQQKGDIKEIDIYVDKGRKFYYGEAKFTGNKNVSSNELSKLVVTYRSLGKKIVTDKSIKDTEKLLTNLYMSKGFLEVEVGCLPIANKKVVNLHCTVSEGDRYLIKSVKLEAEQSLRSSLEDIVATISPLEPFNITKIEKVKRDLLNALEELGYLNAEVQVQFTGQTEKDVSFVVKSGDKVKVEKVIFSGIYDTDFTLLRSLVNDLVDREFSLHWLREKLHERLADINLTLRSLELINTIGSDSFSDLIVEVGKQKDKKISLSLGFDSIEGPRIGVSYFDYGFGYNRNRLFLSARYSLIEKHAVLSLDFPLLGKGIFLGINSSYSSIIRDKYTVNLNEVLLSVSHDYYKRRNFLSATLRFSNSGFFLGEGVNLEDIIADPNARVYITAPFVGVGVEMEFDRRDDRLFPMRGTRVYTFIDKTFAVQKDFADFFRFFSQISVFYTKNSLTVGTNLRSGKIIGDKVPVAERFFAGGSSSHRAFRRDKLGIKGDTLTDEFIPLGGTNLLIINFDLRYSISKKLGVILFVDGGNVWNKKFGISNMRWGVGIGGWFFSPIGPLILQVARKLDSTPGEPRNNVTFNVGFAF